MKKLRYIYISLGDCSVLESQVLELIQHVKDNYSVSVMLLQGYHSKKEKANIINKLSKYDISVQWFRTYPKYIGFWWITQLSFLNLWRKLHTDKFDVFHARSFECGVLVKRPLMRINMLRNLLVDVRGVPIEEHELYGLLNWKKQLKKAFYLLIIKRLKRHEQPKITVVSNALKMHLVHKYKFENKNITVHPNVCSDNFVYSKEARIQIRKELNITDDEVLFVCATGGGAAWQNDEKIIMKLLANGCKILNLSPHKILKQNVYNMFVPFEKMPQYLSAADVAVLWRENNVVNNVASPSKFSEFAAMGLYIIHNGSVELAIDYIKKTKAGCVIHDITDVSIPAMSYLKEHRTYWINEGKKYFGINSITKNYLETLNPVQ